MDFSNEGYYQIRADLVKNRLLIELQGFFSDEKAKAAADQTIAELQKLKRGFAVITDISKFKPASLFGLEQIQRAQRSIAEHGVSRVIRIVDKKNLTPKMQFDRMGKQAYQEKDDVDVAATRAEAEAKLDAAG